VDAPLSSPKRISPSFARRARARRSPLRSALVQASLALATVVGFQVAPTPTRAMVGDFAGQATALARAWVTTEGIVSPRLSGDEDTWSARLDGNGSDTRWSPSPLATALAERDLPRTAEPRMAEVARAVPRDRETARDADVSRDREANPYREVNPYIVAPRASRAPASAPIATTTLLPAAPDVVVPGDTRNAPAQGASKAAPETSTSDLATVRFGL
jgi:hypothetical protein